MPRRQGCDAGWFIHEVAQRTRHCDLPAPGHHLHRRGQRRLVPQHLAASQLLARLLPGPAAAGHGTTEATASAPASSRTTWTATAPTARSPCDPGAWNTGWHDGTGFTQWIGSPAQQQALTRLDEISQAIYAARRNAIGIRVRDPEVYRLLEEAHWRVLRAETSCNFFWGDAWLRRCHDDLNQATGFLDQAGSRLT